MVQPVQTGHIEPVVAEVVGDATLLRIEFVVWIPLVVEQQRGNLLLDVVSAILVCVDLLWECRAQVGQENCFVIPITATQVGKNLVDGIQAHGGIILRKFDRRKRFGLFFRKLEFFTGPVPEALLVLEREKGMPDVVQHLFLGFPVAEQIETADFPKPLLPENVHERSRNGTTRHGGRAGEIEAVRGFDALLPAGVFPLAGDPAGNLLEIEIGLALPEEERPDRFDLLGGQWPRRAVIRARYPDVVDKRPHSELLEPGV